MIHDAAARRLRRRARRGRAGGRARLLRGSSLPGRLTYVDVPVVIVPLANGSTVQPRGGCGQTQVAMLAAAEPDRGNGPPLSIDAALSGDHRPGIGTADRGRRAGHRSCTMPGPAPPIAPAPASRRDYRTGTCRQAQRRARWHFPERSGLAFSPYVEAAAWQARARAAGHEALLALPLQPARYPDDDTGPFTILASLSPEQQLDALLRVLATGSGYVAVTGKPAPSLPAPSAFAPLARALATRGPGAGRDRRRCAGRPGPGCGSARPRPPRP